MKIKVFICGFVVLLIVTMLYTAVKSKESAKLENSGIKMTKEVLSNGKLKSIAWIKIPNTNIDYQICKPKDNNYYLKRNASGKPDKNGAIFYDCDTSSKDDNAVIYGHNMQNNKMFSELEFYRKESFARSHNFIYIMVKRGGKISKQKYIVKAWMMINDKFSKRKLHELKRGLVRGGKIQGGIGKIKYYGHVAGNKSVMLITCAARRALEDKRILVYAERL